MSVYKRTVRGKRARNYSIDYQDENGTQRTVSSGTSDKRLAEQIKRKLVDRVRAVREGLIDPSESRLRSEADRPLAQHVDEYLEACRGRGQAPSGLREKTRHLRWLVKVMTGRSLAEVRADELDLRLTALADSGAGARSVNIRLEAANALMNWCVRNGRLHNNALRVVPRRNQVTDRRRVRRALTEDETARLLAVAREQARVVHGARLRPLWYLAPLLAGLRKGDMLRMRWRDLELESTPPTLTIRGGKAKRRVDVLPLHPDLVREFRAMRPSNVHPSAPVFPREVCNATRRQDFERARIPLKTEEGYADLHALRGTFATRLAERSVPPAKLQRLMRHGTIELTMRYYVSLSVESLETGLSALPGIEGSRIGRGIAAS